VREPSRGRSRTAWWTGPEPAGEPAIGPPAPHRGVHPAVERDALAPVGTGQRDHRCHRASRQGPGWLPLPVVAAARPVSRPDSLRAQLPPATLGQDRHGQRAGAPASSGARPPLPRLVRATPADGPHRAAAPRTLPRAPRVSSTPPATQLRRRAGATRCVRAPLARGGTAVPPGVVSPTTSGRPSSTAGATSPRLVARQPGWSAATDARGPTHPDSGGWGLVVRRRYGWSFSPGTPRGS
jgi:hypothetical protein